MTSTQVMLYSIAKISTFLLKIRNKTRILISPLLFKIVLEVLPRTIRPEEELKGIQTGKEEVKLSLFVDDMILYTENIKDITRKLLEFINEFGKGGR